MRWRQAPLLLLVCGLALLEQGAALGQTTPPPVTLPPVESSPPSSPLTEPLEPTAPGQIELPAPGSPTPDTRPPLPPDWLNRILGQPGQPQPRVFDDYRLGPGDGIFITVQRFPDLSFQATLDIQGNVIVPLAGAINLADLTLEEARQTIFTAYDQYVVNPQVSVTLTTQRPVEVTVLGEVTRPGFYPLAAPQVAAALLTAGGSTVNADLREIRVQRYLADGQLLERTIDLFTPLKAGEALPNVRLQNGDVLIIPRLDPNRLDEYDRNLVATSTLARPEITIRVLNYAGGGRGIEARFNNVVVRNGSRFLDALAQAGVNPDLAAYNRIAVLRFNPEKGSADTILVDALAAVNGDQAQNIALQDNDVIVVDRNLLARITYTLGTFTQPFRDVLGFLLFFDQITDSSRNLFGP
ncbi:polysaccharide export protein [Pseudanabaena sp. FACHB-2040]|nr:polysaccharide export protein [Pseudanabaena sp. FACHB-2040]